METKKNVKQKHIIVAMFFIIKTLSNRDNIVLYLIPPSNPSNKDYTVLPLACTNDNSCPLV